MNGYYKYPRTPHLPWSPGATSDDVFINDLNDLRDSEIVVTEKMDGENTSMYRDHIHARSLDSKHHPSRNWVKQFHGQIAHLIPENWRVCGENLYAKHSIEYQELESYFYVFSIWNENNICLNWQETLEWAELLNLTLPNILYQGPWDEAAIQAISFDIETCEGYVVRNSSAFAYEDFTKNVAKWVRTDHVQTDQHWMYSQIVPNKLKQD